jgi:AcrR family transcriptional regulator
MSGNAMTKTSGATDRRALRTKVALHAALMSLMAHRRYETITTKAICAKAKVGRSTFYEHYDGKDDLKRDGLNRMRSQIAEAMAFRSEGGAFVFSRHLLEHARQHLDHYRSLVRSRSGAMVLERIRQMVCGFVQEELATSRGSPDPEIALQYVVGAYMSILTWWLDGGARQSPQDVDAAFRRMVFNGVGPVTSADAGSTRA